MMALARTARAIFNGALAIVVLLLPVAASAGYFPMYASWPQPGGAGSPITLTYGYTNLLDGSIGGSDGRPLAAAVLRSAFEASLRDYATVLPTHFVEVAGSGPLPESGEYDPIGLADIRIGQVAHIDDANAYAYFPSAGSGLAGDIVFNAQRFGLHWTPVLFYAVAQHELGHSLGMGHFVAGDPPAGSPARFGESVYDGPLIPLGSTMISALQSAYGAGIGSVTPLSPVPEAGVWILFVAGLGTVAWMRRASARVPGRRHVLR